MTKFRLRDWGISRQRYWGCPIPVIHCDTCGVVPEKKENLPVRLPDDVSFDVPGNPLDRHPTWRDCTCPKCGGKGRRETDTMDTFVDSSWYFARFTAPRADTPTDPCRMRLLDERRPVYRRDRARDPAPALFPLLRPRDAHHRPPAGEGDRALRRALHPGHGDARDLHDHATLDGRPVYHLPEEVDAARRRRLRRDGDAGRGHPLRQDVEVEEERRRPGQHREATSAPTPPAGSSCPTARPSATSNGPPPGAEATPTSTSAASGASPTRSTGRGEGDASQDEALLQGHAPRDRAM